MTNKNEHLNCVLESLKMGNVDDLMTKYKKKREEVKEALDKKYNSKKETSPINSGSYAKHTAINTKFDIDICIPFKRDSFDTLEEMANDVYDYFENEYEDDELDYVREQRVSTGLNFIIDGDDIDMDIVPGRAIKGEIYSDTFNLKLYVRAKDGKPATETKTNIKKHIDLISGKNAERDIIRLLKRWKHSHNKKYKSFFIELITIKAFENKKDNIPNGIWEKLKMVMEFIKDNVETISLKDPANSNNIVSDTLTSSKKTSLSNDMKKMLKEIDDNSDNIKHYFEINDEFPCKSNNMNKNEGATTLGTKSFG